MSSWRKYQCERCQAYEDNGHALAQHKRNQHPTSPDGCPCDLPNVWGFDRKSTNVWGCAVCMQLWIADLDRWLPVPWCLDKTHNEEADTHETS